MTHHDAVAQRNDKTSWEKLPWVVQMALDLIAAFLVAFGFAVAATGAAIFVGVV